MAEWYCVRALDLAYHFRFYPIISYHFVSWFCSKSRSRTVLQHFLVGLIEFAIFTLFPRNYMPILPIDPPNLFISYANARIVVSFWGHISLSIVLQLTLSSPHGLSANTNVLHAGHSDRFWSGRDSCVSNISTAGVSSRGYSESYLTECPQIDQAGDVVMIVISSLYQLSLQISVLLSKSLFFSASCPVVVGAAIICLRRCVGAQAEAHAL